MDARRICGRCIPGPSRTFRCDAKCESERAGTAPAGAAAGASPATAAAPATRSGGNIGRRAGSRRRLRFEPRTLSLKAGREATIGVVVENVNDLFSIPFLLQYNPAVISVEEVQHGGFLQGGNQEIAIVQRVDQDAWSGDNLRDASAEYAGRERHRNDHGHRGQGDCAGNIRICRSCR